MKRILTAAVLAALVLLSCSKPGAKKSVAAEPVKTVFAVTVAEAKREPIADYLSMSGDVIAASSVDVYPEASGKVSRLLVSVGSRVAKDEVIAEVDPSRPGMNFLASPVKAPISGLVVSLPAQVGAVVAPAVPVAKISRAGGLEVRTYVAERFVSKMRVGLRAELEIEAYPGENFAARVREIYPVIDPASRTMELRLSVSGGEDRLKPGMYAKVRIYTEEKAGVVTIPSSALVKRSGESFVFVVAADPASPASNAARRVRVKTGLLVDDRLEIVEGLNVGDRVVVRGQTLLDEGSLVNVVPAAGER
jgi:membrane fusion protein (multidrug efflux system)